MDDHAAAELTADAAPARTPKQDLDDLRDYEINEDEMDDN